jgi:hypothetical protein
MMVSPLYPIFIGGEREMWEFALKKQSWPALRGLRPCAQGNKSDAGGRGVVWTWWYAFARVSADIEYMVPFSRHMVWCWFGGNSG